jgi:hypothetical protein
MRTLLENLGSGLRMVFRYLQNDTPAVQFTALFMKANEHETKHFCQIQLKDFESLNKHLEPTYISRPLKPDSNDPMRPGTCVAWLPSWTW